MHGSMAQQLQRPTLVRGNFTTNCWTDCSDPWHERCGMKDDIREGEKKLRRGLSARIRFDKTKISGRHEQAMMPGLLVVCIRRLNSIQR
jgi:hypothetical protein